MKLLALLFLLASINLFGQGIKVNSKKYLDKEKLTLVKYTSCDSTKTLRILTDNEVSSIASRRLSDMYDLPIADSTFINDGVVDFAKKTAVDSNLNVLLFNITVSKNLREPNLEYVMDILENDDILHMNIESHQPVTVYVNYFQVITLKYKCEHVVITLFLPSNEEKKYYYYNTEL